MDKPNVTGLKYDWEWEELDRDNLYIDLGLYGDGVHQTGICRVWASGNDNNSKERMEADAKAISQVPEMINELIDIYQWMMELRSTHPHLVSNDKIESMQDTLIKAGAGL